MEMATMDLEKFLARHQESLERDQARHNLLLGVLSFGGKGERIARLWSLGEGAACAIQTPPNNIVLGDLDEGQCERLADLAAGEVFPGFLGPDEVPERFRNSLERRGIKSKLAMPQRIYSLDSLGVAPLFPACEGEGRRAQPDDFELFADWFTCFVAEGAPHEKIPERSHIEKIFRGRPVFFWEVSGKPAAMAARNRDTRDGSNISFVYTPPGLRGRGYGGSATAFACAHAFAEGKKACFLYTDLRNPISNRVYQKIGFRAHCDSTLYTRA